MPKLLKMDSFAKKPFKFFYKCFWMLILFYASGYGQITLQKEEFISGSYRLSYVNEGYNYFVKETNSLKYISFSGTDIKEEIPSFPTQNLIIALPEFSHPIINLTVIRTKQIEEIKNLAKSENILYKVEGFFWIDNYYCVRITVSPFFINEATGKIEEILEYYIDMNLNQPIFEKLPMKSTKTADIIDNKQFGPLWKSQTPSNFLSQTDSWINYNEEYLKLGVALDGIYRIRYPDLLASEVPINSINPKTLKIYLKGKEIPIYVSGETDGRFEKGDYIEFLGRRNYGDARYREVAPFGSAYYEYLNLYSDTTVYWLTWNGSLGKRIDTVTTVSEIPKDTICYYDELIHSERNMTYSFSLNPGNNTEQLRSNDPQILENETWNDSSIPVGQTSVSFQITNLFPNKSARAFIKLQDCSSDVQKNAHNLALSINKGPTLFDSGYIDKYEVKIMKANFLSTILSNGNNTVDLKSFATSNTINNIYTDWFELEFPRYIFTKTDSLSFSFNNLASARKSNILLTGLKGKSFSLFKYLINDSSSIKITNYHRMTDTLIFADTITNGTCYYLLRDDKLTTPKIYYKKKFVNLRSSTNQADYIAITHPYFMNIASQYIAFVSHQYNITAKLVNINDIYDEYNFGFFGPEPIKEFLKSTHLFWKTPYPQNVFLIGKGTYDFYSNFSYYFQAPLTINYVPSYGNPVSDTWFVQWDSASSLIPQMNIGRIPVKNTDEFKSYFLKHQKYVSKGFDAWNKRSIFFAGGTATDPNQITQCKNINDFIINNYLIKPPTCGQFANFYKTNNPVTNFGPYSLEYINNTISKGGVFISYIGHSGTETWDNSIIDMSQLANHQDRSPLITDFGCSTAKFAESNVVSFSELAVDASNGQAIGYIGNSSLGFTSTAFSFPQVFYKKILVDTIYSIGDIHRLSKIDYLKQYGNSGTYGLFIKTNTLIGDPIVKLPIPFLPNLSFSESTVKVSPEKPTDQMDSAIVSLNYFNFGSVIGDSVDLQITQIYKGNVIFSKIIKRAFPYYADSLNFKISIRGNPGEHTLIIIADAFNKIKEIYESDNSLEYHLTVINSSIRVVSLTSTLNQTKGKIKFLNPSLLPIQNQFELDISFLPSLQSYKSYTIPYDTVYTKFTLNNVYINKRIWVRARYNKAGSEGFPLSYYFGREDNMTLNDSITFSTLNNNNLKIFNDKLVLDTKSIKLKAISAGTGDGNTVVITKNGQNYVAQSTNRGHHICLFNAKTLEFLGYYRYDLWGGNYLELLKSYKTLLDTINTNYIVVIAIQGDGARNLSPEVRESIKTLGSIFIDSISYRGSWALIGRKGAKPGSVPEKYSAVYQGRVQVETIINIPNTNGTFETETLGPVAEWKNLNWHFEARRPENIFLKVIGVSSENGCDTLKQFSAADTLLDISSIKAKKYPRIKLFGQLLKGSDEPSPSISSIEINYKSLSELGTNYQAVSISKDSLDQGENVNLTFKVYNAGESTASNFKVRVDLVKKDNSKEKLFEQVVDSIKSEDKKQFTLSYNTSQMTGVAQFQINIDTENVITELFKDNNFYSVPFSVKPNSKPASLKLTIDGGDILNGDFISSKPNIKVELNDESLIAINDTNKVLLYLNNKRIYYSNNSKIISYTFSTDNPKMVVNYTPELRNGDYTLKVVGKNATDQIIDSTGVVRKFSVKNELQLLNAFNYPNPFKDETYFTFKLTQIPDELRILIFTIAGRKIKEIKLNSSELHYDFNRIYWDGRDADGDLAANGVYLCKIISEKGSEKTELIQKLSIVR